MMHAALSVCTSRYDVLLAPRQHHERAPGPATAAASGSVCGGGGGVSAGAISSGSGGGAAHSPHTAPVPSLSGGGRWGSARDCSGRHLCTRVNGNFKDNSPPITDTSSLILT